MASLASAEDEGLLRHLHLGDELLLLLLQLLKGRRAAAAGLARPQVRLLQQVDLELLLWGTKIF